MCALAVQDTAEDEHLDGPGGGHVEPVRLVGHAQPRVAQAVRTDTVISSVTLVTSITSV